MDRQNSVHGPIEHVCNDRGNCDCWIHLGISPLFVYVGAFAIMLMNVNVEMCM